MRVRDNQKARVYRSERELAEWTYQPNDPKLDSPAKVEAYVKRLTTYRWFEKEFGWSWHISVKHTGARHSARGEYFCFHRGEIKIPDWARSELVILHEVAHAINKDQDRHGPRFVARYILLVEKKMGSDVADRLRAACRKNNVDWTWRRAA